MDTILSDQLIVLGCLLVGNIIFGNIPFVLSKIIGYFSNSDDQRYRQFKWNTFLLYIGAGVFMTDSFLVLMPQANREFSKHHHLYEENRSVVPTLEDHSEHRHGKIPIPELVIVCAFFLTYLVQESLFFFLVKFKTTSKEPDDMRVRFCTCAKRHTECSRTFKDAKPDQTLYGLKKRLMESGVDPHSTDAATNVVQEAAAATAKTELLQSSVLAQAVPNYGAVTNVIEPAIDSPVPILTNPVLLPDERGINMEQNDDSRYQYKFLINSIMITVSLILQYVFLGIQFGMQAEKFKNISYLSQCLQNFILTFSAGAYLASGSDQFSYISIFIGLLSIASPAGLISTIIDQDSPQMILPIAKGIALASACGSLLYSTFYELLHQKSSFANVTGLGKFLSILIGASLTAILQYISLRS